MFLFLCLSIGWCFCIASVIAKISNAIAELVILMGIRTKEVKVEMELYSLTVEAKVRKCSL